ncbi:MAG: hypothetical protein ACM3MI_01285 [Clostridiales bacterium]
MQDEITKHSRKIFMTLGSSNKKILEKFREIFIEIFIIVFSVTLSIWLHGWSLQRHQQEEATEFLTDLRDDLNKDIQNMTDKKAQMSKIIEEYSYLANLNEARIDSLTNKNGGVGIGLYRIIRETNDGNYEGFKSSGKMGYIENKKLKKMILEYYQENMPSIEEIEKYLNLRMDKLEELVFQDKDRKEMYLNPVFKMTLSAFIKGAQDNEKNYTAVCENAKEILAEIDKEVKE